MPVDRELIEVVTVANMAGVDAAQKGFLGLSASALALAAVLGGAIAVGKAAIQNYNAQEEALNLLRQATDATGQSYGKADAAVEDFIQTNKAYIANQYDVIATFGQIIRAGHSEAESLRILNDALDFAVIKHEDVSAAGTTLVKVLAGNSKALKELGITTEQYNAIMKSKMTQEEKDAALLALIEQRTAHGRDTTEHMSQTQQKLNADWQTFTAKLGPGLTTVQEKFNEALDTGVGILDLADQALVKLGQDAGNPMWGKLQNFLEFLEAKSVQDAIRNLVSLLNAGGSQAAANLGSSGGGYSAGTPRHRASGGPVAAGEAYTVGEHGPETLVMGAEGGQVLPHGAGHGGLTVVIQGGVFMDHGPTLDRLANKVARRLGYATGR